MTEGYQPTKTTVKPIPPNTGSNVHIRMADRMYNLSNQFEQLKKKNEELEKENAGLKAGRPQWHNLRKNPNDLPKNCKSDFLLCFRGGTHYGVGFFNGLRFICYGGDYDDVIAWCEIPTFDKE